LRRRRGTIKIDNHIKETRKSFLAEYEVCSGVPVTLEAEAGGSVEPRSSRPAWASQTLSPKKVA
jgi:hypothetical protein